MFSEIQKQLNFFYKLRFGLGLGFLHPVLITEKSALGHVLKVIKDITKHTRYFSSNRLLIVYDRG